MLGETVLWTNHLIYGTHVHESRAPTYLTSATVGWVPDQVNRPSSNHKQYMVDYKHMLTLSRLWRVPGVFERCRRKAVRFGVLRL